MSTTTEFPNWFAVTAQANFERFLLPLADRRLECLQLGVFTGDASLWIMENLPQAHLTDVDPWTGAETIEHFDSAAARQLHFDRMRPYLEPVPRIRRYIGTSEEYFGAALTASGRTSRFDFIYIDGDHRAPIVLADAVDSFRHLRPGGLLAFDDFTWDSGMGELHNPRTAIEAFCAVYAEQIEVLEVGSQAWIRRTA